jgi:alpha-L-fucosidase
LLNVPPTREGLLHSIDVARLGQFRARVASLFEDDLARGARRTSLVVAPGSAQIELDLGRPVTIGVARLAEDITRGQTVARYTLYGAVDRYWKVLSRGSTIGYAKLDRFEPVAVRHVRLAIEDGAGPPQDISVMLYNPLPR